MKYIIIALFVFCVVVGEEVGLRCYTCTYTSVDSDRSCLTVTDKMRTVECPYQYCTIVRQEFLDPSGVVASFVRGCEDRPDYLNHEVTDSSFRTFYRACTSDLCNIGNGIQSLGGSNLSPRPLYEGENLLVPGTGKDSAGTLRASLVISLLMCIISQVFKVFL